MFVGTNNKNPRDPKIKGDKGVLMCFRETDGKFLWQAVHDKLRAGRVNDWPEQGIVSSPAVDGNRLYYVSNRCELVCADVEGDQATGKARLIWILDMIGQEGVFPHNLATSSPLVVGNSVFVVTGNGVDEGHLNIPHPLAPSFLAVDKRDGHVLWSTNEPTSALIGLANPDAAAFRDLTNHGRLVMHGQWSSPVYAEVDGKGQVVFPGGDGWLRAFEPATGTLLWKFDGNPKDARFAPGGRGTRSDYVAVPVVCEGRLFVGIGQDPEHNEGVGHLWCIDLHRATRLDPVNMGRDVSPVGDDFDPRAAANAKSALAWHFGGLADRAKLGRKYVFGRTLSSVAVHDGLAYAADLSGDVFCLDAASGAEYWHHTMDAACWSMPSWIDGKVHIGNDDGQMLVFAHGKEKRLLATVEMEDRIRAAPVAANGVLYLMTNEGNLFALAGSK